MPHKIQCRHWYEAEAFQTLDRKHGEGFCLRGTKVVEPMAHTNGDRISTETSIIIALARTDALLVSYGGHVRCPYSSVYDMELWSSVVSVGIKDNETPYRSVL